MDFLERQKDKIIESCPICSSLPKDREDWPTSGTHVFTVPYLCGTEIDYPIGHEGASFGTSCDGKVKRFDMDIFLSKFNNKHRK